MIASSSALRQAGAGQTAVRTCRRRVDISFGRGAWQGAGAFHVIYSRKCRWRLRPRRRGRSQDIPPRLPRACYSGRLSMLTLRSSAHPNGQAIKTEIVGRASSLQRYLSSFEVRGDTQAALIVGIFAGVAVVMVIIVFPGTPIDYSGVGLELAPEMSGGSRIDQPTTATADQPEGSRTVDRHSKPGGVREIEGLVVKMSELRRRNRKGQRSAASESAVATEGQRSEALATSGNWEASGLDEEMIAQKIRSSKAARMLGLSEEQVRHAVLDAKREMQREGGGSLPDRSSRGQEDHDGLGSLSGMLSVGLVVLGMGAFWVFLSADPHGPLARFLAAIFPREMETLGFAQIGGKNAASGSS